MIIVDAAHDERSASYIFEETILFFDIDKCSLHLGASKVEPICQEMIRRSELTLVAKEGSQKMAEDQEK
jgi:hypothetical protein